MQIELDLDTARLTLFEEDGEARWLVNLDAGTLQQACFRKAFVWRAAGMACIGAAEHVWFFDLEKGTMRLHLDLNELQQSGISLFGDFGYATLGDGTDLLIVLTYTGVIAIDTSLTVRWIASNVAVDGITGANGCNDSDVLAVQAEMDPPGGWFEVLLDARTGRELGRKPHFLPGYAGSYRSAPIEGTDKPT